VTLTINNALLTNLHTKPGTTSHIPTSSICTTLSQASNSSNGICSLDHRDLPRFDIIRQPDDLRALLNKRRPPQLGDILSHAILDPGNQKKSASSSRVNRELSKNLRARDLPETHRLDLFFLGRCDLEQRLANDGVVVVRHAAVCCFASARFSR
jgi:hypothetical protein